MHIPVLKEEVLHFLNPKRNENFIDCTAGEGGHAFGIIEKNGPSGKVMAIEWDEELYNILKKKATERFVPVNSSYTLIKDIVKEKSFFPVNGVLFDLGFSSFHVDESGRGFSFMRKEPLDMRYNKKTTLTAYEIVNKYRKKNILYILKKWGEEDYAERIAHAIVSKRREAPIETTEDLTRIIESVVPKNYQKKTKINCATKTFQALRIAVNGELLGLKATLPEALEVMERGGRMAVICFHGGEEKLVRRFFRFADVKILTPRPVVPSEKEINKNVRSRSAKLYAVVKN